jgi:hypothetical protein
LLVAVAVVIQRFMQLAAAVAQADFSKPTM